MAAVTASWRRTHAGRQTERQSSPIGTNRTQRNTIDDNKQHDGGGKPVKIHTTRHELYISFETIGFHAGLATKNNTTLIGQHTGKSVSSNNTRRNTAHARTHARTHAARTHARTHASIQVRKHAHTRTRTHARTHVHWLLVPPTADFENVVELPRVVQVLCHEDWAFDEREHVLSEYTPEQAPSSNKQQQTTPTSNTQQQRENRTENSVLIGKK